MRPKTLTRLQPGHVIMFDGRKHRVAMVNESRALIVPLDKKVVEVKPQTGDNAGTKIVFARTETGISIAPNSEIEIVGKV